MASFTEDKVIKALKKKGFVKVEKTNHTFYCLEDQNGKRTQIRTFVSRNGQDINDYLISNMAKQVKLSKTQFLDLINCPLSYEKYIEILSEQGAIY